MKQPNVFGKMFEGGDQRGNRWTQGGEREERKEGGETSGKTAGRREGKEKRKEGGTSGKPLDAGRGKGRRKGGRREEGGELTLINTIIKKT